MGDNWKSAEASRAEAHAWGSARPALPARLVIGVSRRTVFGHGTGRKVLTRLLAKVHQGPVDDYVWGVPMRLYPWNNACERKALMRPDQMDPTEHRLLAEVMSQKPSVFVDIGANVGLYSLHAVLTSVPGGTIIAIEPNSILVERFRFNLKSAHDNGRVANDMSVTMIPVALSDHEGEAILAAHGGEGGSRLGSGPSGQRVSVRTLHTLLREQQVDHIDLMKIDVEGHEDRILPGFLAAAPETLWPKALILEHLSRDTWSIDCIDDCLARGYRIATKLRGNTILERSR
jgi:FkbM family methyltransferase